MRTLPLQLMALLPAKVRDLAPLAYGILWNLQ